MRSKRLAVILADTSPLQYAASYDTRLKDPALEERVDWRLGDWNEIANNIVENHKKKFTTLSVDYTD